MTFEILLAGYDGGTDATDHLVKWINAPSLDDLNRWIDDAGLRPHIADGPHETSPPDLDFGDGVDIEIDGLGHDIFAGSESPELWIKQSQEAVKQPAPSGR